MTALHLVQLQCADCDNTYPFVPRVAQVRDLRAAAADAGWEVMSGKHGKDQCPECRIALIRRAMDADTAPAAEPDTADPE